MSDLTFPHPGSVRRSVAVVAALASGLAGSPATANVFGIKSCAWGSPDCGIAAPAPAGVSQAPTQLFSFGTTPPSAPVPVGRVTIDDVDVDADALALSPVHGLLGYQIRAGSPIDSALIAIDSATAAATPVGDVLSGREIRAAAFDLGDTLWVIDVAADELLRVDPATGAVQQATALTQDAAPFDATNVIDLAVRADGVVVFVDFATFYTLDTATGALTEIFQDLASDDESANVPSHVGVAYAPDGDPFDLLALDVSFNEDVFVYATDDGFLRTELFSALFPAFNSGRGDLATLIAPLATTSTSSTSTTTTAPSSTTTTSTSTTTTTLASTTTTTTTTTTSTSTTIVSEPANLLPGRKLLVTRKKTGAHRLQMIVADPSVRATAPCEVAGELAIESTGAGAATRRYPLEASLWAPINAKKPEKGCTYRKGPVVATVLIKTGKTLKVIAQADDLGVPLATDPRAVRIELRHGDVRHCAEFGGTKGGFKAGKKLLAKRAAPAVACPGGSPEGAFVR